MTESDTVFDKLLERQDLLCDELAEECCNHLTKIKRDSQRDYGHHEFNFDVKFIEPHKVNSRNKYYVKLGEDQTCILNYTSGRTKAKAGIGATSKLYEERFAYRVPVLNEWLAFGYIFNPSH